MTDIRRGIPVEALRKRFQGAEVVAFGCLLIEVEILHELQMFAFANCNSMQIRYNTINFKEPRTDKNTNYRKLFTLSIPVSSLRIRPSFNSRRRVEVGLLAPELSEA